MAFTSETKKELENYISGHLPNKEWYESHFYPFIENKSLRDSKRTIASTCSYASFSAIIVSHDTESKKLST